MLNDAVQEKVPQATITPLKRISGLWLIPIVTLVVGGWMVYDNWSGQGPLVTISFATAEGLEAGKTKIKIRDVDVGQVEELTLNEALDGVIVSARINLEYKDLLVEGSRFWVVQPTVTLSGVSGLGTLLTGQYIRFSPADTGRNINHFDGLNQPPVTPLGTPGLHVSLTTEGDISFAKGDPIYYQGIAVGKIEDVEFNFSDFRMYYNAFIEAPYHLLVSSNTRFWKTSGIHAELTGNGFELDTGPLLAMISGGISFITPAGQLEGETVAEQTRFHVYPNRSAINEKQYVVAVRYWVMVNDTIGGLYAGAPVSYRGIQIGKVLRTDYVPEGQSLLNRNMAIPVLIEINPGRLGLSDNEVGLQRASADINTWISQGLHATISSQNFLLGSQLVELQYSDTAVASELSRFRDLVVIPAGQDTLTRFTDGIELFIAKVNELPLNEVITKLDSLLDQGNAALSSIRALTESSADFVSHNRNVDLVEQLTSTMSSFEALAQSFSSDSQANQQMLNMLQSISFLVEEFRPLVTELKNRPNSLVFPVGPVVETIPLRKAQ